MGGKKTGGRKAGTPNKATAAKAAAIAASGLTPLDYMLTVLRDESADVNLRLTAARSAAPYVHSRLHAIEHTGRDGGPIETSADTRDLARVILSILREAQLEQ